MTVNICLYIHSYRTNFVNWQKKFKYLKLKTLYGKLLVSYIFILIQQYSDFTNRMQTTKTIC